MRTGNQHDALGNTEVTADILPDDSLPASDIFEGEVYFRQSRTEFRQGQVDCSCQNLPIAARHTVLTAPVERCPESTSLTPPLGLLPGRTLICSNLLAKALPPS